MHKMQTAAEPQGVPTGTVDEIWALLRMLFGQHRRSFLIAASELSLHPAQARALMQLSSPLPMSELAGQLGCDSSNVTGLVDRLEARGLVARRPSFDDRRVKHVVLTEAGRAMRQRMLDHIAHAPQGFERLSADEQQQLRDQLRRVLEADPDLPGGGAPTWEDASVGESA
jgi:MarR family transcriptional regulator, organic hydroperoxide resistance regulator